jgi:hypothetical protein
MNKNINAYLKHLAATGTSAWDLVDIEKVLAGFEDWPPLA